MRILLSNDDGVGAPGLEILKKYLEKKHELIIVAPDQEKSASGHALSLRKEIPCRMVSEKEYAVSGFPADCVSIGLLALLKDNPPDLVISGINRGGNLGQDGYYSGTVAAAREAIFRGVPGIAVSLVIEYPNSDLEKDHFEVAASCISDLLEEDLSQLFDSSTLINVNVPNLPKEKISGIEMGGMGFRKRRLELTEKDGRYSISGGDDGYLDIPGSDCELVAQNKISISALNVFLGLSEKNNAWRNLINKL